MRLSVLRLLVFEPVVLLILFDARGATIWRAEGKLCQDYCVWLKPLGGFRGGFVASVFFYSAVSAAFLPWAFSAILIRSSWVIDCELLMNFFACGTIVNLCCCVVFEGFELPLG